MDAPDHKNGEAFVPSDVSVCSLHPYPANLGGGICASCLKEKLGKLISSTSASVSSSSTFPLHLHRPPSSSSSSSTYAARSSPSSDLSTSSSSFSKPNSRGRALRAKIPGFLYYKKKKKKNRKCAVSDRATGIAFRRSTTAPKRPEHPGRFLDEDILEFSPRKKGFWSFFFLPASNHLPSSGPKHRPRAIYNKKAHAPSSATSEVAPGRRAERTSPLPDEISIRCADVILEDVDFDGVARNVKNFDRKVSRSRSVGCGSRSFSGDFFERISTGFGDCTFRRVQSTREPNGHGNTRHRVSSADSDYCIKNRVRCGRIFGGFLSASTTSSLSSSSYRVATGSSEVLHHPGVASGAQSTAPEVHGRSRSWGGWVFASPLRGFGRPSRDVKSRGGGKSCNAGPESQRKPFSVGLGGVS